MKIFKRATVVAALLSATGLLFSGASTAGGNQALQLVNKITQNNAKIVKQFDGINNLQGFVIAPRQGKGQKTVVYADKKGRYMIAGAVIDKNGQNVTQGDFNKYVTAAMAPKVLTAVQSTHWLQDGNASAPHKVYVLVEPNCVACHMLYKALAPQIKSGQLAVRWIFVAFLKPSSVGKAAAIMQSKNIHQAFAKDEKTFNVQTEVGGIAPSKNITAKTKQQLKTNMQFMTKFNFIGTPVMVYQTKTGTPAVVRGFLPGKALLQSVNTMSGNWS